MIELAMWANLQAQYSGWVTLVCGILGLAIPFRGRFEYGIYAVVVSIPIILLEYPRSKRAKGSNVPRPYQEQIAPVIAMLGFFGRNYFMRFVIHLVASVPMFFFLPTMLPGIFLFCASVTYFAAALRGEQWAPVKLAWGSGARRQDQSRAGAAAGGGRVINAPTAAPPRRPAAGAEAVKA